MNNASSLKVILAAWVALFSSIGFAQTNEAAPDPVGPGQPPVVVSATSDKVAVSVVIREDKQPVAADFSLGLVTNDRPPSLVSRPKIESFDALKSGDGKSFIVHLGIGGLFAFGESSVPLLQIGRASCRERV